MISLEIILEVEQSLRSLEDDEVKKVLRRFERKQTAVFVYLAAVCEREELNEDEQDVLFSIALILWTTLLQNFKSVKKVSMERIEELDNEIMALLEANVDKNDEALAKDVAELVNQTEPNLFEFILMRSMKPDETAPVREDIKPLMVLFLKAVLEGFLEVSKPRQ
jgi:hypothetical protein